MPRVASADPQNTTPTAANRSVLTDRLDKIGTTGRMEAAPGPNQRADDQLVQPGRSDQDPSGDTAEKVEAGLQAIIEPHGVFGPNGPLAVAVTG